MKEFICWYAYKGHETEGRLDMHEPQIYEADDMAGAMWQFHEHLYLNREGGNFKEWYDNVEDYRETCENITGWGWWCRELKQ